MAKRKKVSAYARKVGAAMKRGLSMKQAHKAAKSGRSSPKKRAKRRVYRAPSRTKRAYRYVRAKTKSYKGKRSSGGMARGFKNYSQGLAAGDAIDRTYLRITAPVPQAQHPFIRIPLRAISSYFGAGAKGAGLIAAGTQIVTGAIEVFVGGGGGGVSPYSY